MRGWERLVFILGLVGLAFFGGVAVGKFQYWPYEPLDRAKDAANALWTFYSDTETPLNRSDIRERGVTRWERGATQDGLTFIPARLADGPGAVLVDMDGRVLHRWQLSFTDAFPGEAPHIRWRAPDTRIGWHGVRLFANGDVLLNLEGGNFPFGGGLVLIDKDSRIKWKLARNTHHDLDVQPDGRIVVLAHDYLEQGVAGCNDYIKPPYLADKVLWVSPDGNELDSFSLAEAFCGSPFRWLLMPAGNFTPVPGVKIDAEDLLHANNVEVITPAQAEVFPMGAAGDYLVSFRNLNLVAVVDKDTRLVKWALVGNFARQHDPDILANGNILLFDNLGGALDGPRPQGRSRILEIDPVTQRVVWNYEGGMAPEDRFDAEKGGNVQKLANGNVLLNSSWSGRVLEVTGDAQPRIVWEYVNVVDADDEGGLVGAINDARRFDRSELTFLPEPAV